MARKPVRLFPPADPDAKVGIPVAGELYDPDDAARLVGAGLASRTDLRKAAKPAKPAKGGTDATA